MLDSLSTAVPRDRRKIKTTIVGLVLAALTALLVPLGLAGPAAAEDGNPTFYIGSQDGSDYVNFINALRGRIDDGGGSQVDGAGSSYQVNHTVTATDWQRPESYVQVDIHAWGSNTTWVRLQLRRTDLYLVGWWDNGNDYHYIGDRPGDQGTKNEPWEAESSRSENGQTRKASQVFKAPFGENYSSMEGSANQSRNGLAVTRDAVNGAVWSLWNSNNGGDMARGALMMTQFVSEAARFRPIRDSLALTQNGDYYAMPSGFVDDENNWSAFSSRFNWLITQRDGYQDPNPLTGYARGNDGSAYSMILRTAVDYAHYLLVTSLHRS
ncbi:ribosome-inactivating family protein [Streptomyces sp. NPDC051665]|uniref:ribosome-inactivating family protein n=1 Tax=Streptomyces sp. NPDC051665 TaxID=3154647 RepID=UPI003430ACAD